MPTRTADRWSVLRVDLRDCNAASCTVDALDLHPQLRRELKDWLERARSGDEVVITERGRPVARLIGIGAAPLLDQLTAEGRISAAPNVPRPRARDRERVRATGDVADLIVAERDARR